MIDSSGLLLSKLICNFERKVVRCELEVVWSAKFRAHTSTRDKVRTLWLLLFALRKLAEIGEIVIKPQNINRDQV